MENEPILEYQGRAKSLLLREQMYGFRNLGQMPSPETVRVLGEFLFDPWGLKPGAQPGMSPDEDEIGLASHASFSLHVLSSLPLTTRANATPPEKTTYWADIDAWKLWYEQVRAGTRTIQFEGDPQHYNLQGPVATAIEPSPTVRHRKPAEELAPTTVEVEEPSGPHVIALTAACVLLGVALWFGLKRGKRLPK